MKQATEKLMQLYKKHIQLVAQVRDSAYQAYPAPALPKVQQQPEASVYSGQFYMLTPNESAISSS